VPDALVTVNGSPVGNASPGKPLNIGAGLPVGEVEVQVGGETQRRKETIRANEWTQAWFGFAQGESAEPPGPGPEAQLAACEAHFKGNRLTTGKGGNAADCYAAVLGEYPGNPAPLKGLAAIEARYNALIEGALTRGELDKAQVYLGRMERINPESLVVGALRKLVAQVQTPAAEPGLGAVSVLSVDHVHGAYGQYFNFLNSQVDKILGRKDWNDRRFFVRQDRTGKTSTAVIWRHPNGGSIGDGCNLPSDGATSLVQLGARPCAWGDRAATT